MASAALVAAALGGCATPPPGPPRNLLLVSLDTTRPDHLSAYGYPRQTTPRLAELAAGGALFRGAIAQWTATSASHASLLTGLYPHVHGMGLSTRSLPRKRATLTRLLRRRGFRTGAFVSGYTLRGRLAGGLQRGFEVYDDDFVGSRRDGALTVDRALAWLAGLAPEEPYFLFVHLFDAHGPYGQGYEHPFLSDRPGPVLSRVPPYQAQADGPRGGKPSTLNDFVDLYDAGLRYQDRLLARVLEAVDLDTTAVIVVGDHGETLGERPWAPLSHATGLFEEQIRIPLVIHAPGVRRAAYDEVVESVDLLPTALGLLAIEPPKGLELQGESLLPLLRGERGEDPGSLGYSAVWARARQAQGARRLFPAEHSLELDDRRFVYSVRSRRWKLLVYPGVERDYVALFDLQRDPDERESVAERYPEVRDRMLAQAGQWLAGHSEEIEDDELTPAELRHLRALGYVD